MNQAMAKAAILFAVFFLSRTLNAQTYSPPKTPTGQPDLQGIWQVQNTSNWDLESHAASHRSPAGFGVVVDPPDGKIPYQPEAADKKKQNFANRATADPVEKCYLAGVPRTMYLPYPFQILQTPDEVMIFSEYVHTVRWIPIKKLDRYPGYESWMGDPRGRFEGNTLVVESIGFNDQTWFDYAGNFHSDALKTTERFTRTAPDVITYEVTIEDPKVFTRPWTIRMPIYQHKDMDQLLEYECFIYTQELNAR